MTRFQVEQLFPPEPVCIQAGSIPAYIEQRLDAHTADAFAEHLATCSLCRREVEELRAFAGLDAPVSLPRIDFAGIETQLTKRVQPSARRPPHRTWRAAFAMAASLFGLAIAIRHYQATISSSPPDPDRHRGAPVSPLTPRAVNPDAESKFHAKWRGGVLVVTLPKDTGDGLEIEVVAGSDVIWHRTLSQDEASSASVEIGRDDLGDAATATSVRVRRGGDVFQTTIDGIPVRIPGSDRGPIDDEELK